MQSNNIKIKPYNEALKEDLILIWERSVRATHDFLIPGDIEYFKEIVKNIDFNSFPVYCSFSGNKMTGFIGLSENIIEMLFLDPDYIGTGFGKLLIEFAIIELNATEVHVNEDNRKAVNFYSKFGFTTYERTPKDSQGKDYPILKMRLVDKS